MFAAVLIGMLLVLLLAPSWVVLAHFGRLNTMQALKKALPVWIGLVAIAAGLIFSADAIGLTNPLGYTLGICVAIGVSGANFFWLRGCGR